MSELKANAADDRSPAATVTGFGQSAVNHGSIDLAANVALADKIAVCKLPAGHVAVDFILDTDDLDSGSGISIEVGVAELDFSTVDRDALIKSSTIARSGGLARLDNQAGRRLEPVEKDRLIVVEVTAAPTTSVAGTITGTLISRLANKGY